MIREIVAVVILFSNLSSTTADAACSACTVRSSREDSPAFCDDLKTNVCKKIKKNEIQEQLKNSVIQAPRSDRDASANFEGSKFRGGIDYLTEYIEPGYEMRLKEAGVSNYADYAAKMLGGKFKVECSPAHEADWKTFFTAGTNRELYKKLFPELASCSKIVSSFTDRMAKASKNNLKIQKIRAEAIEYRKKLKEDLIQQHSKNVRAFVQNYVSSLCYRYFKEYPEDKHYLSDEDQKKCSAYSDMRQEVAAFPDENDPGYAEKAQTFVRKWMIEPEDKFGDFKIDPKNGITDLETSTNLLIGGLDAVCAYRNDAQVFGIKKLENDLYYGFFRSKTFIESVFDKLITPERQAKVKKIGAKVRDWMVSKIQGLKCAPKKAIEDAIADLKEIETSPYERPKDSEYEKDIYGNLVLRDPAWGEYASATYTIFGAGNPEFFKDTNARYRGSFGKRKPYAFVSGDNYRRIDSNEEIVEVSLAHEFGHALDIDGVMGASRPEFAQCYSSTLECLMKGTRGQIRADQLDETVADVYRAEYLADELLKVPVEDRRRELGKYMELLCNYEEESASDFSTFQNDPHPDWILRINSILGGNKKLRKTLGCSLESNKVPVCEFSFGGLEK